MSRRPQVFLLPDGRRLHLQDGPIDLICEAFGTDAARHAAYAAAAARFAGLLDELCDELICLRAPAAEGATVDGPVARRMMHAVRPFAAETFITPMAAVAGAVADEILQALCGAAPLARAYCNNGGDIALYCAPGEHFAVGLVDRPDRPNLFGTAHLSASDGVGGIATSGRHGRSFSRGIADAVTILAEDAAAADAAATVVANAVDLPGDARITRVPADNVQPDSDLGSRLVTRDVTLLDAASIAAALRAGETTADRLIARGLGEAAALHLQGETRVCGRLPLAATPRLKELAHA